MDKRMRKALDQMKDAAEAIREFGNVAREIDKRLKLSAEQKR